MDATKTDKVSPSTSVPSTLEAKQLSDAELDELTAGVSRSLPAIEFAISIILPQVQENFGSFPHIHDALIGPLKQFHNTLQQHFGVVLYPAFSTPGTGRSPNNGT